MELPVYIHEIEAEHMMEMTGTPEHLVRRMKDGDTIELGNVSIEVLHTPGHSPGSCGLLAHGHLIAGDTLFVQGIGRVDLPGSSADDMFHSLERLKALPPETKVYPGHNYGPAASSTIGQELERNPYLRVTSFEQWRVFMGMM